MAILWQSSILLLPVIRCVFSIDIKKATDLMKNKLCHVRYFDPSNFSGQDATCFNLWRWHNDKYIEKCNRHYDIMGCHEKCSGFSLRSIATRHLNESGYDPYEPDWSCPYFERVGDDVAGRPLLYGDGRKVTCSPQLLNNPTCLVYSFGSNNELSFERGIWRLSGKKCDIRVFDPTPRRWQRRVSKHVKDQFNGTFYRIGLFDGTPIIVGKRSLAARTGTLLDIMQQLDHSSKRINILKVDIDGHEWGAFPSIFAACQAKQLVIDQLLIELHMDMGPTNVTSDMVFTFFNLARACGLRMFYKEPNTHACGGWGCAEFSFVNEIFACQSFNLYSGCNVPC